MKQLSKAEERVLHIIWSKGSPYMRDIMAAHPSPKPAKTTLATVLKRMSDKEYITYDMEGSIRKYRALIKKNSYLQHKLKAMIGSFFDSSPTQFASFFAEEMDLSEEEVEEIQEIYRSLDKKEKS